MSAESEPAFLSLPQLMSLHRASLAEHGGIDGVRDPGAVESALASAQAFLDGNKRTAISAAVAFLTANDCEDRGDDEVLYDAMIAIARREMDKAGLAEVLRKQFPKK